MPGTVREHHLSVGARLLYRIESAPQSCLDAEHREKIARRPHPQRQPAFAAALHRQRGVGIRQDLGEGVDLLLDPLDIERRQRRARHEVPGLAAEHRHQLPRCRHRQRPEEEGVDDAEHRRVETDRQCQGEYRRDREAGMQKQLAPSVAQIAPDLGH